MDADAKICTKCFERKPIEMFSMATAKRGVRRSVCKACHKLWAAEWWRKNGKESYLKHKAYQREWREKNPEKYALRQRRYHLKRKYQVTIAGFQERVLAQGGKCAICQEPSTLVVDHCHRSSRVRELLCQPCNKGLGGFRDNPRYLEAAIKYLEKHNEDR